MIKQRSLKTSGTSPYYAHEPHDSDSETLLQQQPPGFENERNLDKSSYSTSIKGIRLYLVVISISACFFIEMCGVRKKVWQFTKSNKLTCVYALGAAVSGEGIGALLQRNQLAAFVSSTYNLPFEFPHIRSSHGYDVNDLFGHCPAGINKTRIPDKCQLRYKQMRFLSCPKGDCRCKRKQLKKFVHGAKRDCELLGVWPDDIYNLEFTGCLGGMLSRYFGNATKPKQEYNVVHYRKGDLEKAKWNPKVFSPFEIGNIIEALCYLNDFPIVVLTEGTPEIPICGNRIILASDLSIKETFKIAQHAKNIAVGESTFAMTLMEVAKPESVIMLQRNARFYEWFNCEKWTILGERGSMFHFKTKKDMVENVITRSSVRHLGVGDNWRRTEKDMSFELPKLRWSDVDLFQRPLELKSS